MGDVFVEVVDQATRDPVSGAVIQIGSYSANTNSIGVATLELPKGNYTYSVTADNYKTASGSVDVDENTDLTVAMESGEVREPAASEEGTPGEFFLEVIDRSSGDPIDEAQIHIGTLSESTNEHGLASLELPQGTHNYTVRKGICHGRRQHRGVGRYGFDGGDGRRIAPRSKSSVPPPATPREPLNSDVSEAWRGCFAEAVPARAW